MAKKHRAVQILKNAASNYVRQILQILVFILLTPFIVSKVGSADFGLWSLIQAVIGLFGLMDLGFSTSVVKYVAEARGQQNPERLADLTASFFWQYVGLGVILAIATLGVAPFLPQLLGVPAEKASTARIVFVLVGLRAAQGLPLGLFAAILVGFQKQVLSNITRVLGTISYGLTAWWALSVSPTIETLAHASLWTGLAVNLLSAWFCISSAKGMSLSPSRFQWTILREISSFSLWFFLIQISLLIATRVDTLVVNAMLPLTAVAIYAVAIRISEQASVLCRQLTNALTPVVAELKGAGEESNIRAVFLKGSMLSVASSVPLLLGLAWLAEDLAVVWMGEGFRESALPCRLLLAAALVVIVHSNTDNVLSMTGHQRFLAISQITTQVLNFVLTVILIRYWGLMGVALATLIAQLVIRVYVQWKAGELNGVKAGTFYSKALWPSIPGAVACVGTIWAISKLLPPTSLVSIGILLSLGGAMFFPAFWYLGLTSEDRGYYGGRLKLAFTPKAKRAEAAA